MPENPQPQPGPTPTPTPIPAVAILIGAINDANGGATITPNNSWIAPFFVTADYLETCKPQAGGFFVIFQNVTCFMPALEFEERYG